MDLDIAPDLLTVHVISTHTLTRHVYSLPNETIIPRCVCRPVQSHVVIGNAILFFHSADDKYSVTARDASHVTDTNCGSIVQSRPEIGFLFLLTRNYAAIEDLDRGKMQNINVWWPVL